MQNIIKYFEETDLVIIYGEVGSGKSNIAIQLFYYLKDRNKFADEILFIDLSYCSKLNSLIDIICYKIKNWEDQTWLDQDKNECKLHKYYAYKLIHIL